MNKIFKVIWSKSKQCYIVVSEMAKNHSGKKKIVVASILAAMAVGADMSASVHAVDEGTAKPGGIALGSGSFAGSDGSIALGKKSYAVGTQRDGTTDPSIAIGQRAVAIGNSSLAVGLDTDIRNSYAVAVGRYATVNGDYGIGMGFKSVATEHATAVGESARSKKMGAAAYGVSARGYSQGGVAIGIQSLAGANTFNADGTPKTFIWNDDETTISSYQKFGDVSIGLRTMATGGNATALGRSAAATEANSIAIGGGDGNALDDNKERTKASAEKAAAIGYSALASGKSASALGTKAKASAENAAAVGTGATASAKDAFAAGTDAKASEANATAIGKGANAEKSNAIAIGTGAISGGTSGIAMGNDAQAQAADAIAVGSSSRASNDNDSAFGNAATAGGSGSTAIGYQANTTAANSTAIGAAAQSTKASATALGNGAKAFSTSGIAIGEGATVGVAEGRTTAGTTPAVDAPNSIAIGKNAKVLAGSGSIALGADTQITASDVGTSSGSAQKTYPYMLTNTKGTDAVADKEYGIVAIGTKRSSTDNGFARRLTGVAGGVGDYDAVNLKQAKAIESSLKKGERHIKSTSYSPNGSGTITLNYVDGENNDVSNETATITDVAKKSDEWMLRTQDGTTSGNATPQTVSGSTKKAVTLKAGDNIAIDNSNGVVTIKAKNVVTSITSGNTTALTVSPSNGAVTITPNIASSVGASGQDGKLVTSGIVKTALDAKIDKTAEMHIKTGEYTVGDDGIASLIQQNGNNQDQSTRVKIKDIAKKSDEWTLGVKTTTTNGGSTTSSVSNITPTAPSEGAKKVISLEAGKNIVIDASNNNVKISTTGLDFLSVKSDATANKVMEVRSDITLKTNRDNDGATGQHSVAIGAYAEARNLSSTAIGNEVVAANNYATALGYNIANSGEGSVAIGKRVNVDKSFATTIGYHQNTTGNASASVNIGYQSTVKANQSVGLGSTINIDDKAQYSTAIGYKAKTLDKNAIAIGSSNDKNEVIASGVSSVAIGTSAQSHSTSGLAIGDNAVVGVAEVKDNQGRVTTAAVDAKHSIALGTSAKVLAGQGSVAIGWGTEVGTNDVTSSAGASDANKVYPYLLGNSSDDVANDAGNGIVAIGKKRSSGDGQTIARRLTGLAGAVGDYDAVNLKQLKALESNEWLLRTQSGENATPTDVTPASVQGETKKRVTLKAGDNIAIENNNGTVTIKAKDVVTSITSGNTTALTVSPSNGAVTITPNIASAVGAANEDGKLVTSGSVKTALDAKIDKTAEMHIKTGEYTVGSDGNASLIQQNGNNQDQSARVVIKDIAKKSVVDGINTTVGTHTTQISNLTTAVEGKVSQTEFDTFKGKAITFTGDDNQGVARTLDTTLTVKGGANYTSNTLNTNIQVAKDGAAGANGLLVKLSDTLTGIKSLAGDEKNNLIIKNGTNTVTITPGKGDDKGTVNFGDAKVIASNLEADITYRANSVADTAANTVKLKKGLNFVAATDATTTAEGPKAGLSITTGADGLVTFGLDKTTREKVDNAADKNLSNLSEAGNNKITNLAKAAAKETVKVAPGINTTVDTDTTTTEGVTTYKVNANDTRVAITGDGLAISGGDLGATDRVRTYTLDLSDATKGKLTAVGGLATVIGGTTIADNGTVTGPTFNITNATGGTDTATTLKDAIDKLNKTNEGQNTTISNLTTAVTNNYNDLSNKITNAGTAATAAATAKGLNFTGDDTTDNGKVHRDLGETLTIKGGENFTRGTSENNIKVVKNNNDLDVKLAENLGNIKEIAGDGTHDLVIKNGDTKVTVKAPKDGNTGSIDFGDTKLVASNLDASIKYRANDDAVGNAKSVKLADGFNYVASSDVTTTTDGPKSGLAITAENDGKVTFGLDKATREKVDNAADKNLSNLSEAGNNKITNLAKAAAKETVKVAPGINTTVDTDTTTTEGVTTYKVNANDTRVAITGDGLAISGGDLGATDRVRTYTLDLSDATKGKLTAVGGLATVIGGTTIADNGTVTGPTFNITNATGGTDTATTLKDAIDKLNKTNEGQNTTISNLTTAVTNNYNDLSNKITNAGTAATAAATAKGLNFTGDDTTDNGKVHRDLGETLTIKGGENFTRGTSENNIKVVKNNNDLDVKLAENLGNIKEIAGDGTHDLVIKNGDTKVTVKAPKDGNTGSIDFGDTKLVASNLDASIKYRANDDAVGNAKSVKLADGFNYVASSDATTTADGPKSGLAITAEDNGKVTFGLDKATRTILDNAASKTYVNDAITNLNSAVTGNARLNFAGNATKDAQDADVEKVSLALATGTLHIKGDATDITTTAKGDTVTIGLTPETKGKLTAVGNLANVIGGTTITTDGTVTGPTFNITNATGGTDTATTLKDAIDKLNKTNEGQNTTISNLTTAVTNNYNDLSNKITNAGTAATAAATAKGLNFTGDDTTDNGKVHRDLGETLTIKGGENFTRGTSENNIKVVKNNNDLDVKLAENLGNIKEIAGDGTHDLVIKNGDTKVTVKAPKDGNTGSIDFGDTKLVTNNLDANISYKAGTETDKKTVKLQDGFNFVAGTGTVAPKHLEAGTTSPTEATDSVEPKKGIAISTAANGVVNIGLDGDTRGAIDNAADKNLSNLSEAGNNKITNLAKAAAKETVKVADGLNTTVDTDTTTTEGVTTYKVNANDTRVAITGDGLAISGGDLGATDRVRTYTLDLSDATKGKLTAVGGLATVIGGTTIADNGTVTGPTFNITNATGGTDTATTLKDAIDKLNATNEGQNTAITKLGDTVTKNYNTLSDKIDKAGETTTNALTEKGLDFYGNKDAAETDKVHRNLGQALKVKGAENFTREATATNNIDVVKNAAGDGFDVKLAENLGNIKEIAGDGTHDLVIKNGDTKVTVKAPKDGNTGSIDFGDTKLVASNLDASIKYRANDDAVGNAKSVKLADGFNYVASSDATTTTEGPKSGLAITAEDNGKVTFGLDKATRTILDDAASKAYVNEAITNLNTTVTGNARLNFAGNATKDVQDADVEKASLALATDTLHIKGDATDITTTAKGDTVTIGLTPETKGKLTAVGNLANVIGGTTITTDGTVTGPTFNITNATGGTDTATTLKDAIDKLNATNEGQNTAITKLGDTVTKNYNTLSDKIDKAGETTTNALTEKGLDFYGNKDAAETDKVHRNLGQALKVKGTENFTREATATNNIDVVKNTAGDGFDVKLAENLGNIKEIAGDGTHDLVIKNGDTKVTVKAPKDGNTGSIDFGDTKLVASNLDASIKYRANDDAVGNAKSVKLADGFNYVASNDVTTTTEGPKSGLAITAENDGKVTFGLDKATREKVDNAADKNLSNLSEAGNNKITNLAKAAAKETVKVAPGINTTVDTDTTTTEGVTTYKVNANDTRVAITGDGLAISGGDLGATDRVRTYTLDLSDATKGKLTAVGGLATVIGGTTIADNGTVTGPTFNITNATGGTDTATTLKDAIDKLNATNEGQNTAITKLGDTVTKNYNTLSDKIDKAGETTTNALTEKGLDFYGNKDAAETDKVHRNLGQALKVKGAENFTREATATNNIDVVKNTAGDGFDVKLAENLGNIKEIAGDGTHDLVIKNGDTKVTVKAPKDGNTGSIDFGDTKLVTNNLDANISYKAGTETDKKTVKLQDGFNFVAGTGTVAPKHLEAGTTSPTEATDSVEPKKGIAISTAANGVVNIGLDSDTRGIIDNAASKDYVATELANLNTTITGNANLNFAGNVTKDAQDADVEKVGLALAKGTLHIKGDATDITTTAKGDTVTIGLTPETKGKLTAVGNLANVIGGTTITTDGTVTGPTFNITNATGGTDTATTLKDAIDKLNATNEGQNTAITKLGDTVTKNYNTLSDKIDKAGETTTNALTEKGLDFYGNKDAAETDKVHRNLGQALKVKGAENFTREATATNNIDVVKNAAGDGFDVKLAENLGNIKEIAGDGTHDLVIKNGDTKVTVKAPKDGNTGSIDFGDTKLVASNLDASIKYRANDDTAANAKSVKLADGFNYVASNDATTTAEGPKSGLAITAEDNGKVTFGLDKATREKVDNAADKNLSNLSEAGNNKITNLAKAAAKETVKVADGINTKVDTDTTTTEGVTTYKVNANDTKVAIASDGLAISGGDLGATDRVRTYTLDLSDATKGKLTAVGNLANVIGGTTITTDGTVTGPTFNITNATGGTDTATTLKDAIDKLNATNEGQNTAITKLGDTVTKNYNTLSDKIDKAGETTTNALTEKGLDFYGNKDAAETDKVHRNLGQALKVKGAENFTREATATNNIDVVKNTAGDGFDVKLAENLGNIKEIAGDGTHDLVIKNGDTKVTVKAPKDGNTGSIDFGDTKLVTNNLDANISYKAGTETDKKTVKLQDGFNFVAGTGTVAPKHLEAGTTSPTEATDSVEPKKGIAISTAANGVVNIGLDGDTRGAIDNAADKNLSNLSEAGNNKITNLAKAAAKETVKVAPGINTTVDTDTTTTEGVTTYKVNANDTRVAITGDGLAISGGDLGATDRVRTYTLDLSDATKGKLTAVGGLATVIGGTTIADNGTVTGPTFNITNATGGTDTATTLKDAIDKLNATNEGQNTAITKLGDTVTKNYNTLSDKIDKAGETTTNALTEKGLDFYGNKDAAETDKVHRNLGQALKVKGAENFTREATATNNIDVVKNTAGDGFDVKLAENLGNIKEIAGDGTHDLVIKNGDTKVTVKAPKDGNTGSIDFGDTKLVTNNLDANISYKAGTETDKKTVKLQDGFNFVAGTGTVAPKHLEAGTTSPTEATDSVEPKKGIAISTAANGVVNIGLDGDTRGAIDNAADKNLSNLSEAGNNKITNLAKAAAKETVKVAPGINTTVDTDTTTTEGVTTYKVNANDTKVAIASDGLAISGGDLGATDRVRTYTLDLSDATKGKLTAVGGLATVIGGTTIADNGTVTGPTFNITNATGGTDTATTLKDAIDKLNATNEGQNTAITKLGDTVTKNYNTLSDKIDKAGETTTNALTEKGLDFYGNKDAAETDKVHRNLGQALKVKGAENFTREATATNNIDVVKNTAGDGFDVKLAENLGNIKEIAGDGTHDLVIKNGDTKVTVKAPKDGNTGSIDFGDTKLVTNNLDANISYKAGTETDKKAVKLQDGFNFIAGTGTVAPKHLEAGTASPTATTDSVEPKKGIVISTEANGVVNIGLDNDTRSAIDNAANQDLSNLTTAGKKVITDAAQGSVKVAAGKNVTIDTETKDNVTTYTVNANDTLVTSDNTLVTVNGGTLGEDKVRTYTLGLSTAVTDKLAQLSAKNADGRDGKLGSETDAIASKDIAKADGLNGETATYKVNALRHGEAGSVVYTDADGNRIVKATDGNYYKATEVNANGVVKTPAENNGVAPVAVEKATIVATLVNTNGTTAPVADDTNKVATTKLTNIKEAAITATSNDAVTGRQLHGLKSDLATVLGGNSTVDANGTFTGPTYNITKDDGTNTTDPVKNVGDAITKLDTRINNANTTLSTKGLDFYGNKDAAETDKVHRNLGEALKVKGAENFTRAEGAKNNIDVVKNAAGDGFDVKLAENLGNIKEIAGNGTDNLVIKNGDATITVKPGKAGSTDPDTGTVTPPTNPSVDFGNTTLVVKNIEADITYRANNAEDADAHTVKLKKGLNFVAGTGTVAPKYLEAGTASPTATTDSVEPKKGIVISTEANGVVNIGLDNDTRSAIDNAANQDLSNLTTAGKKVITDAAQGAVKVAAGNNITVDTETKDNVTKYTVNGRDTTVQAAENGSVSVTGGTLNDKGERKYTVDLTDATKAQINRIDGIDTRLTTAENNITTLQGDMKQAKQDITTLQGDMKQAKTDITVLQGDMKQAKQDITNNTNNIATNTQNIKNNTADIAKNAKDIAALQGNSATKDLSNLTNAGKDVVTGLVNVVGTNGITVTNATDTVSRVKTFTAKLDDKVTFGKDGNKITIDGTTGTITAPNATINVVNTNTVQVGDTNKTNTAVTPEGVTVTTKQPNGTVTSTVIIKDGTVSGLTNTKWDPTKVTDADRSKAATQGQMKDVSDTLQKGRVFAADTGVASTTVALGDTLAIKGGANGRLTDNNIGVELTAATAKEPATMTVRLAKDVKMKDGSTTYQYYLPELKPGTVEPVKNPDGTVKYKTDAKGNPIPLVTTTVNGEGVTITPVKELNKPSVTLTADGLDNGGNAIHNVGPGTAPNDAATVGQVSAAAGTLSRRVNEVGAHAAALAAMNPLSYDPLKKSQVMAGYGAYKGNNAVALGVAHYANEDTLFNVGVSVGNGDNMVNAGVTYRFGGEDSMIPERYKGGPISSVYVMQDEITALKAENARKDVENAKKEAENEEMKAQIKMLIERVTMLEAKK